MPASTRSPPAGSRKNALASPVTLKAFLEDDEGLKELGGPAYLCGSRARRSRLAARDYAQMIYDLAVRRELIGWGRKSPGQGRAGRCGERARDQIVEAEQALYELAEQGQTERGFQSFLSAVTDAVNVANAAYQREGGLAGVSTGLTDMDRKLGGLHPPTSDPRRAPSMGKTSLATNIAFNIAKAYRSGTLPDGSEGAVDGGVVGFFSLEMSPSSWPRGSCRKPPRCRRKDPPRRHDRGEFRRFVEAAAALEPARSTSTTRPPCRSASWPRAPGG
jgi:replicative DNA helicase